MVSQTELLDILKGLQRDGVSIGGVQWVMLIVVILISSVLGSLVSSYFKSKGANLATKEDVEEITKKVERVRHEYATQRARLSHQDELRLVAPERRLQAHQEAYALCWQLYAALGENDRANVIKVFQDFWKANCLYLSREVRDALSEAERSVVAGFHVESGEAIRGCFEAIVKSVELPSLGDREFPLSTEGQLP